MKKTHSTEECLAIGEKVGEAKKAIKIRNNEEAMILACDLNIAEAAKEIKALQRNIDILANKSANWAVAGSLKHIVDTLHDLNTGFEK